MSNIVPTGFNKGPYNTNTFQRAPGANPENCHVSGSEVSGLELLGHLRAYFMFRVICGY